MGRTKLEPDGKSQVSLRDRFAGVLIGTAVGDALGLPAEGMSAQRILRLWRGEWRHRFLFGRGMCSDDTEHTFFVAQTLLSYPDDSTAFQRGLGWKLRFWLFGIPAGVGLATARAIIRLWLGWPPSRSGVFSAGNGPAMRSAILGAYFANEPEKLRQFVAASTRLTHTDSRAETGALAVAHVVAWQIQHPDEPSGMIAHLKRQTNDTEWLGLLGKLEEADRRAVSVKEFCLGLGLANGVSGYVYHSVPVAIYAWLRHHDDFQAGLKAALDCGGDTDTVGAITGAMLGACIGASRIPDELRNGIIEWPRTCELLERVAARLAEQKQADQPLGPARYCWPGLLARNLIFLIVVLLHGLRRLAPPY